MLHLYDTRTRTAQAISPMDGKTLRFYCCGPTVYGPAHIGNFRTFVMQDVFRRVLELGGVPTTHIRNLTDVDDKTIRDSQKAGVSLAEFTAGWADLFHRDCAALNCLPPHAEPSAVGHIPEQIRMVQTLVEKGHAYVSEDGSVYFRISSFPEYGRLSHLDERELDLGKTANTRSNADEYEKDSVADFVLWKSRRPEDGDNFWTSPWGEGRPGWHLECSAMIHKYFGNDFDLHSGGVDLVFPHHENEVAQSRCACGGGFARLWFHITHLLVDGGKMSKSLGNFFTVREIGEKYDLQVLRFFMLSAHYRSPLNFSAELMEASKNGLDRILTGVEKLKELEEKAAAGTMSAAELENQKKAMELVEKYEAAMEDDFNTADAVSAVFELVKLSNSTASAESTGAYVGWMKETIERLCGVLGIITEKKEEILDSEIEDMIAQRQAARKAKDFALADQIRGKLLDMGIILEDTREGVKWKRA